MDLAQAQLFIFLAFFACALELSFQRYIKPHMLLFFWGDFLKYLEAKSETCTRHIVKYIVHWFHYILGGCVYCNGFWIAVAVYLLHYKQLSWYILLFTGLNYLFLSITIKICKILNKGAKKDDSYL